MENVVLHGDCLEVMKDIPDGSVDMILCDLPFNLTAAKWDKLIPFNKLWEQYKRIIKENGAIVLNASQPFTSALVMSNLEMFKYEWIWEKSKASNFLLAKKQPLKAHENILVFCKGTPPYYPQKTAGKPYKGEGRSKKGSKTDLVNHVPNPTFRHDNKGDRFPRSVQYFITAEKEGCLIPTQKPVKLFQYLIETYTLEGQVVLDSTAGSGTTGEACLKTNRKYILIEKDPIMFEKINNRLAKIKPKEVNYHALKGGGL